MQRHRLGIGSMMLAGALVVGSAAPARAGEGFGFFTKKTGKLIRVSPPAVFLLGNRITVKVSSSDAADAGLAGRLQTQLESELIARDQRFMIDGKHPDEVIDLKVLQNRKGERWENRQEVQSRKVGTDAKGRDKFESYNVDVRYQVVSHSVRAAYKVTATAGGRSLDADSLAVDFEMAFREGSGAPDQNTLETREVLSAMPLASCSLRLNWLPRAARS